MMKRNHKAWMAAGLLAGAAALTGCSAATAPVSTPTPDTTQKATVQPQTAETTVSPDESPAAGGEETPGPLALRVDGKELDVHAVTEEGGVFLPLEETAKALGWEVTTEEMEEETQVRRSVRLSKDGSQITVAWISSDNTAKQISWQKDGLLIPVNTELTSMDGIVYVPAAFFETAMRVTVETAGKEAIVHTPEPEDTPENDAEQAGENEASQAAENG